MCGGLSIVLLAYPVRAGIAAADGRGELLPPFPDVEPSAVYGEVAPGTAHPGVDFPRGNRQRAVAAAADGEIVLLRISEVGYRRALHLRLPDGREVVYAHLGAFLAAAEESCAVVQERLGSHEIEWRPGQGSFRVARGEPVGWTTPSEGEPPFIHIEVRVDGVPRNPWTEGMAWEDMRPPRIEAIEILPLASDSRIEGGLAPHLVPTGGPRGRGSYPPGVRVWGTIGVLLHAEDGDGAAPRAPEGVALFLDGARVSENDLGERVGEGLWDPATPDPRPMPVPAQRLYAEEPGGAGRFACGEAPATGVHRLRVLAWDAAGNSDTAEALLDVRPNPRLEEWMARPLAGGAWDIGVRCGPREAGNIERLRVRVDLTEDAERFPIHEVLGHLGGGWFLGEVTSPRPRGRVGLRVRLRAPDGWEVWEPTVSLDPSPGCATASPEPPAATAHPFALEIAVAPYCIPAKQPRAWLEIVEEHVTCRLLEVPTAGDGDNAWRFLAEAQSGVPSGVAPVFWLDLDTTRVGWPLTEVFSVDPAVELSWVGADSALTLEGPAGTFNAPEWLVASRRARAGGRIPPQEIDRGASPATEQAELLIARSDAHRIDPSGLAPRGPLRVRMRPRAAPSGAAEAARIEVYGRSEAAHPWHVRGGVWNGREYVTVVDRLEEWILIEDRTEPWLYALSPAPGQQLAESPERLVLQVREDGSGLAASGVTVLLDRRRVPAAWDPATRRLTVSLRAPLERGWHRWDVRARDRAGNVTRRAAEFRVIGAR